jgi:hypothetical protein
MNMRSGIEKIKKQNKIKTYPWHCYQVRKRNVSGRSTVLRMAFTGADGLRGRVSRD